MSMPKIECTNIDKCCAASSLVQSIALEETALSHILNAEGEKSRRSSLCTLVIRTRSWRLTTRLKA